MILIIIIIYTKEMLETKKEGFMNSMQDLNFLNLPLGQERKEAPEKIGGCGNRCKSACPKKKIAAIGINIDVLSQMTKSERALHVPSQTNNCGSCIGQIVEALKVLKNLETLEDVVFFRFINKSIVNDMPELHNLILQIQEMNKEVFEDFCRNQEISSELNKKLNTLRKK